MTAIEHLLRAAFFAGLGLAAAGGFWLLSNAMASPEDRVIGSVGLLAATTLILTAIAMSIGAYVGFAARIRRRAGSAGFDWDGADRIARPLVVATVAASAIGAVVCLLLTTAATAALAVAAGIVVVGVSGWQIGTRRNRRIV